ncbi:MAG: hypothetical protein VB859_17940 [Planctomycetaceae bacterium]
MGSFAPLTTPVDSRWPSGWQMAVDPATRAFLNVLRRLNPRAYRAARSEAEAHVDELVDGAVPESSDLSTDYKELADRLGLEPCRDPKPDPDPPGPVGSPD